MGRSWELVGAQKASTIREYAKLYPEASLVFVGDDGQGDRYAAEALAGALPQLTAAFIHQILDEHAAEVRYAAKVSDGIYLFRTYVGASLAALRAHGPSGEPLLQPIAARRVTVQALAEMNTMRMLYPKTDYSTL